MGIRRGTTPTFNISIDIASYDIAELWITFAQQGRVVLNKTLDSEGVTIEDVTEGGADHAVIHMRLFQTDTLQLKSQYPVQLQLRALMEDDSAAGSAIIDLSVDDILKDGIINVGENNG